MAENLNYTTENLFDIKCLVENWKNQIKELNTQKRVLDGKIELLYENIDRLESYIEKVESQNKKM